MVSMAAGDREAQAPVRQLALVIAWLVAGHVLAGGAYVALINTPESNALMLTQSAVLVLAGLLLLVLTSTSAGLALQRGLPPWRTLRPSLRLLPVVLVAVLVIGVICAGAGWLERWWVARSGEVDAALIAAGDITRTGWLHTTVEWLVALVQWVLVPVWLAASLVWASAYGARHVLSFKWLVAALRPRALLVALAAVVILVWLPWSGVYWRPAAVQPGTLELIFTGVKLLTVGVLANIAWALVLDEAARPHR
jgi:hypothetical protein